MSMKDNVDYVKQELNSEEKFLEGTVKAERFLKKYKSIIIGVSALFVIAIVALTIKSNMDEANKQKANLAFEKLLTNHNDKEALATLEETNKNLYDVALYLQAKKENKESNTEVRFLKELAAYEKALNNKDINTLNTLAMENDFLLKEFAIFNRALLLTENGKYKEAQSALALIPETSNVNELVKLLKHHLSSKL